MNLVPLSGHIHVDGLIEVVQSTGTGGADVRIGRKRYRFGDVAGTVIPWVYKLDCGEHAYVVNESARGWRVRATAAVFTDAGRAKCCIAGSVCFAYIEVT
jgi:hypothetical protein